MARAAWWPVAAGVLFSVLLLGAPLWPGAAVPSAQAPLSQTTMRFIAVLPLANVTQDPADQVFADGLTETLTSSLTQLEKFQKTLRVVPASEIRSGRISSVKDARQAFGVTLAISGSMQRLPSTLRLTLNLVDAAQLSQISSRTIDIATSKEVITQETVISAATALLALELDAPAQRAITAGGTATPGAYELYVKGRGYLQRFDRGADNIDLAIDALSRAIATDPKYALAHTALGEAYWRKYEATRQTPWIDRATEHAEAALAIDSRIAAVHVTLAMIARGRGGYEEAIAVARRAVELDPVSGEGYRELGRSQEALHRAADAEATYRKATEVRPEDWLTFNLLGSFYLSQNRLPEAETAYRRVIALTPDNTRGYNNLGLTYFRMKRVDDAVHAWEQSAAIRPTYAAATNLGTYYFGQGRYADAARTLESAVALAPNNWRAWRNLGAAQYWVPDQRDKANASFEKTVALAEAERKTNPRQADLLAELADAYSLLGRKSEAQDTLNAAERLAGDDGGVAATIASVHEQQGQRAEALRWLARALDHGYAREQIERSPFLAALRNDRRYRTLVTH
jgi:tetratricopeptide (TPR) repeat protein